MSLSTTLPLQTASPVRTWVLRAMAGLMALAMMVYGLAAIDAGVVNFRGAGNADVAAKRVAMQKAADAGQVTPSPQEIADHSSVFLGLLAATSSPTYAYGKDGLSEPLIHYATMPKANGITLSLHNALGGMCMLFGALQFWPAFRRRFPKWHRAFGAVYLVAAQSAMVAAMVYLARTPITDIYDHLTFYIGLWGLAVGVTLSLWMAVISMLRKQIAQHQAWMCLNYGMLLTAPIQRYGWLAFGTAAPELRQLEGNYAVTGVLVPLCVLIGYGLFTINRWLQADRSGASQRKVSEPFERISRIGRMLAWPLMLALAAAGVTTVQYMLVQPSLGQAFQASTLIPTGVIALTDGVIGADTSGRVAFTVATLLGLLGGIHLIWSAFIRREPTPRVMGAWAVAVGGTTAGALLMGWGVQMGMPSFATLSGGALYLFGGGMTVLFSGLLTFALLQGQSAWVKEWSLFVLACLASTAHYHWALPVLAGMPIDPQFVQAGHIHRLASYGQWMLLIGAFVYAAYSEATHSKLAR